MTKCLPCSLLRDPCGVLLLFGYLLLWTFQAIMKLFTPMPVKAGATQPRYDRLAIEHQPSLNEIVPEMARMEVRG